jgi:hypothetical protein
VLSDGTPAAELAAERIEEACRDSEVRALRLVMRTDEGADMAMLVNRLDLM